MDDRVWKGTALAGVAAAGILVALGQTGGTDQGAPGPSNPGATQSAEGVYHRPTGPTPLDGTWEIGPVTGRQIRAQLRQVGDRQWVTKVMEDLPRPPLRYRMTVARGRLDLQVAPVGGRFRSYDREWVSTSGENADLEPIGSIGVNRYHWRVVGDRLRLTFLSTSESREDVGPDAAFQRTLCAIADWTRTAPAG